MTIGRMARMRKASSRALLAASLAAMFVSACSFAPAIDYPSMRLRAAHDINESHPTHQGMVRWNELLQKATNGKMQIQIFPNAVLGSTDSQITQCIEGSLDIVVLGGFSLLGRYNPEANLEMLPFLFESNQSAMKALDGAFGKWVTEKIAAPAGFQVMSYMCNGLRHLGNNVRPINVPADMKGLKFRASNVSLLVKFFEAMGSTAIPMPFTEVFTGLQQKMIDGFENPAAVFNANRLDEVCKYMSLTGHSFTTYLPAMNIKKFSSFSPEVRKVLLDTCQEAAIYQRELLYKYEDDSVADLKKRGMIFNDVDKDAFKKAVQPVWDEYIATYGRGSIDLAIESQK